MIDQITPELTGDHKAIVALEILHALVVTTVVIAATVVYMTNRSVVPSDLLGFVYGGAITYAGGRAAQARGVLTRGHDTRNGEPNGTTNGA